MNFRRLPIILLITAIPVLFFFTGVRAQSGVPGKLMPIPERISGNFGEFRSHHFHAGIDYKTNELTGYEVYAADDGFVSRVKVSNGGYGRAIYLTHPGRNLVTVYAHLSEYYPELNDTIRGIQYASESYETEIFPDSGLFQVTKGQIIGYSGNSGSSEGPHLHFETRNRLTEKPFNPELSGFRIADTIPPQITALAIYFPGENGRLAGSSRRSVRFDPAVAGNYSVPDTLYAGNTFFIGFEGHDLAGNEINRLGFREWKLTSESRMHYKVSIDSFSFDETRMINSMIDYPLRSDSGRTVILCRNPDGNRLSFKENESGLISIQTGEVISLTLTVADHSGNITGISFNVKSEPQKSPELPENTGKLVRYGEEQKFKGKAYEVGLAKYSLYEDNYLDVAYADTSDFLSGVLAVSPYGTSVHDRISVGIMMRKDVQTDSSKVTMVHISSTGQITPMPGKFINGFYRSKVQTLGRFALATDTVSPEFGESFWFSNDIRGNRYLVIPLKDNLAGISRYRAAVAGTWVRTEYNLRRKELLIEERDLMLFDDGTEIVIEASDTCGNRAEKAIRLKR